MAGAGANDALDSDGGYNRAVINEVMASRLSMAVLISWQCGLDKDCCKWRWRPGDSSVLSRWALNGLYIHTYYTWRKGDMKGCKDGGGREGWDATDGVHTTTPVHTITFASYMHRWEKK